VHYIPVHRQPYYRMRYGAADLPGAENYYARTLSLPLHPGMSDSDVERVTEALTHLLFRPKTTNAG
jgi:dTDP-4-amino-4,6-dideoxygalactose transaminase